MLFRLFCIGYLCSLVFTTKGQKPYDYKWSITQFNLPVRFDESKIVQDTPFHYRNKFYTVNPMSSIYIDSTLYATNSVSIASGFYDRIKGTEAMLDEDFRMRYRNGPPANDFTMLLPKRDKEFYSINRSSVGGFLDPDGNMIIDATYYSVIDAAKKEVKSAKHVLNRTMVTPNFLTATRHANGRDFWIVEKAWQGNTYYIYRTTPDTIVLEHIQTIGDSSRRDDIYGSGGFSPDGTKFGVACITQITQYFDFDRCSGRLSNPRRIAVPWITLEGDTAPTNAVPGYYLGQYGIMFSPSGRFVYINSPANIFQYDLQAGDSLAIKHSETLIVRFDTTLMRIYNNSSPFDYSRLTPNGKIMYTSFDYLPHAYSLIHHPDSAGFACGFDTFGFAHTSLGNKCLPAIPVYSLGALIGSGCDTAFTTGVGEDEDFNLGFELYPNPASASVRVSAGKQGYIVLYDILGKEVLRKEVQVGEQTIAIEQLSGGVYHAVLQAGSQRAVRRLSIVR